MKRVTWVIILFVPILAKAQGIQFENGLSWEEVKQKARHENKYIFVDCTASWCKPCKQMEKEIFSLKDVGDFINVNFISVHVQMDTSKNDEEPVRNWYAQAHELQQQYKVTTFPTYLFFSPEGTLVHRYMYSLMAIEFLKTAAEALDPNKQYCMLVEKYLSGKKDYSVLPYLSVMAKNMKEGDLANQIATDYLHNYLDVKGKNQVLQKKNFQFLNSFFSLLTSKDNFFKLLYDNTSMIDSILNQKGTGKSYVQRIIKKEEVDPKIWKDKKPVAQIPDWNKLNATITKKYNQWYADKAVLDAQYLYFLKRNDSAQAIKYRVKQIDKYGLDTAGLGWVWISDFAWDYVFGYCTNKDTINKAVGWLEEIVKNHPDDPASIDTYANLLYKAGRKEEALLWEQKAQNLEVAAALKEKRETRSSYTNTLEKMKKGVPTW